MAYVSNTLLRWRKYKNMVRQGVSLCKIIKCVDSTLPTLMASVVNASLNWRLKQHKRQRMLHAKPVKRPKGCAAFSL